MSKIKELITLIKDDETIIRFKELENIIDHNRSIKTDFDELLHLQKIMVKKEFNKEKSFDQAKKKYDAQLNKVLQYPVIEEYLDLLDIINNDLSLIKSIIESEIALDFD